MNYYRIIFWFTIEMEREYGTRALFIDVVARSQKSAVLKAERTIPRKMLENLVNYDIKKSPYENSHDQKR